MNSMLKFFVSVLLIAMPICVNAQSAITHVANLTALKAVSTTGLPSGTAIYRDGFAAAGDGGGAYYTYITSACSLNSGSGDNGVQVEPTSGSGCWIAMQPATGYPAMIFQNGCDGSTDITTALNAALINWAGHRIMVPNMGGACIVSATISVPANTVLEGQGIGITVFKPTSTNPGYPVITLAGINSAVRNLTINGNASGKGTRLSDGILCVRTAFCYIDHDEVYSTADNGIESQSSSGSLIGYNYVHNNYTNGIYVIGNSGGSAYAASNNVVFYNTVANNSVGSTTWDGVDIDPNANNNIVTNNVVTGNDIIIFDDKSKGNSLSSGNQINNNTIIASPENGIDLAGAEVGFRAVGNYILNPTGYGILVNESVPTPVNQSMYNWDLSNNWIGGATLAGIYITSDSGYPPSGFSVDSNKIFNSSQASAGAYSGIQTTTAASDYSISRNLVQDATSHQKYAIDVSSSGTNGRVRFNDLDTGTVGFLNPMTASGGSVAENTGYNPVGILSAPSVPSSGTSVTNSHPFNTQVCVYGGTVSSIAVGGSTLGITSGCLLLPAGQAIKLTYSAAPSWTWFGS